MKSTAKKFYKTAIVSPEENGFAILLDGKPVKTPLKHPLALPTKALAEAVAGEWRAQGEKILPETMPLTGLANAALDIVADMRADIVEDLLNHAETDLLCHREEKNAELIEKQAAAWNPVLDWLRGKYGVTPVMACGLMPAVQPPQLREAMGKALAGLDAFQLAGVAAAAQATGSLFLALALAEKFLDAGAVYRCALMDELFQAGHWGEVDTAEERREIIHKDLQAIEAFLRLL